MTAKRPRHVRVQSIANAPRERDGGESAMALSLTGTRKGESRGAGKSHTGQFSAQANRSAHSCRHRRIRLPWVFVSVDTDAIGLTFSKPPDPRFRMRSHCAWQVPLLFAKLVKIELEYEQIKKQSRNEIDAGLA